MNYIQITADDISLDVFASVLSGSAILSHMQQEPVIGFGCIVDGVPVAACVSVLQSSKADVLSLFVLPDYRRRGIGKTLLSKLYWELFYTTDASYISIGYNLLSQENTETLTSLLRSCGYRFDIHLEDYRIFEFCVKDLVPMGISTTNTACSLSSLGKIYANNVGEKLQELEFTSTPSCPETTDYDLSLAIIENKKIASFVWVEKLKQNIYRLGAVYNSSDTPNTFKSLIGQLIIQAKEKLRPDDIVVIDVCDSQSATLLDLMTAGKAKPSQLFINAILML